MSTLSYLQPQDHENNVHDTGLPVEAGPASGDSQVLDLRRVLNVLWRRKMIIVATAFIVTTLTVLGVLRAVPLYIAAAQIVVEDESGNLLGLRDSFATRNLDFYTNQTEAAVITSRGIAERACSLSDLSRSRQQGALAPAPEDPADPATDPGRKACVTWLVSSSRCRSPETLPRTPCHLARRRPTRDGPSWASSQPRPRTGSRRGCPRRWRR